MKSLLGSASRRVLLAAVLAIGSVHNATAATLVVTNLNDSGAGSLRAAVAASTNGDTIVFDPALTAAGPATLALASSIPINSDIVITGPGSSMLSISTAAGGRHLWIAASRTVTIEKLTFRDGSVLTGSQGGSILHYGTLLTVRNCRFMNSSADYGGAIAAMGPLVLEDTEIIGNTAGTSGGGVFTGGNVGTLDATRCIFSGNTAGEFGGGIGGFGSSAVLTDCILSGNAATVGLAGGIYSSESTFLTRCTITDNTAASAGGLYCWTGTTATSNFVNTTISGNVATMGSGVGGMLLDGTMPFVLTHVTVTDNTGGGVGGVSCAIPQIGRAHV